MIDRIVNKVTSGQWILTVACAFTFCWCAVKDILPPEAISAIIGMVFTSYFNRKRPETNEPSDTNNGMLR